MEIDRIDHLVLTVRDIGDTIAFYGIALGMEAVTFGEGRRALKFGRQKINLHQAACPIAPHASHTTPGSADICFVTETPLPEFAAHLAGIGVAPELGPVRRSGAMGPINSIYLRDPDGNLIEVSNYY